MAEVKIGTPNGEMPAYLAVPVGIGRLLFFPCPSVVWPQVAPLDGQLVRSSSWRDWLDSTLHGAPGHCPAACRSLVGRTRDVGLYMPLPG